jgi:hypothetical protein
VWLTLNREFKVPSYQELEEQFYYSNKSNFKVAPESFPLSGTTLAFPTSPANGVYLRTSTLELTSVTGSGARIVFVQGDLNIKGNITFGSADPNTGIVFVVSGNINIDQTVTQIYGVLVSEGIICTAANFVGQSSTCLNGNTITSALKVYGSLISINKSPLTGPGQKAILFTRTLGNSLNITNPAEEVLKQAKYLAILKNGLFTKDLIITQENKFFDIDPASFPVNPPAPPAPGPPAPPPAQTGCSINPVTVSDNLVISSNCDIPS